MKKSWILCGLAGLWILPLGCGSNSNPTAPNNPPADTATFTPTKTHTPTFTVCINASGTPCSVTPTLTASPTVTGTPACTFQTTSTPIIAVESNDNFGAANNLGSLNNTDLVAKGTVDHSGDSSDYFQFVPSNSGMVEVLLDCYDDGGSSKQFQVTAYDHNQTYLSSSSGGAQLFQELTINNAVAGQTYYILVFANIGVGSYKLIIVPPPVPTATPTYSNSPTFTVTPSFTPTFSITPNPSSTPPCSGSFTTFGKTAVGASSTILSTSRTWAVQYALNQAATFYGIAVYLNPSNSNSDMDVALYDDNGGTPNTKLQDATSSQVVYSGWNEMPFPPIFLAPGTYWLVFEVSPSAPVTAYYDAGPANSEADVAYGGGVLPGTFPGGYVSSNHDYSVYAVGCNQLTATPSFTPTVTFTPTITSTPTAVYPYSTQWGSGPATANGQFNQPTGIAALDGNAYVYVTDGSNNRVQYFDQAGGYVGKWGSSGAGNGQFNSPKGIAVAIFSGDVFVVDTFNNRIQYFDVTGTYLGQWGSSGSGNGQFNSPTGIAIGSNIYVADSGNNRIQEFDGSGNYLRQWGSSGSANGQFNTCQYVAVDLNHSDNVYVTDDQSGGCGIGNDRVQEFSSTGTFIRKWGFSCDGNDGDFHGPYGIALDGNSDVFVVDNGNSRIQKFDSSGNFLAKWGSTGTGNGQFSLIYGIAADTNNNIYVADTGNNRVQKFAPY